MVLWLPKLDLRFILMISSSIAYEALAVLKCIKKIRLVLALHCKNKKLKISKLRNQII